MLDNGNHRDIVHFGDPGGIQLPAEVEIQVLVECHVPLQTAELKA